MATAPVRKAKTARTLKQRAVAMLARREFARAELASRLAASGASRTEIEPLLEELAAAGLLSDARYASSLVNRKQGYSKRAIAYALREKGVAAAAASDVLATLDAASDLATASALWLRRFGSPPADQREKLAQLRFLLARGFSYGVANKVVRSAGAAVDREGDA